MRFRSCPFSRYIERNVRLLEIENRICARKLNKRFKKLKKKTKQIKQNYNYKIRKRSLRKLKNKSRKNYKTGNVI